MGISSVISGPLFGGGPCGWREVLSRDGYDGGQLTIELNTCEVFAYLIESFPQDEGGTADLEPDDFIIVWDEDATHGEDENEKNFSFTGTYAVLEESAYEDYLKLSTTDERTNWAVYQAQTSGTFTKGGAGTNEHEILQIQQNALDFTKTADANDCVFPDDEFQYTICFDNDTDDTFYNTFIIDYLPEGVDYDYIISVDPLVIDANYNPAERYYIWEIGTIGVDDADCVTLDVIVNDKAPSGGYLHNIAELWDNSGLLARAHEDTQVCCWDTTDPNIIFVDQTATGNNTGMDWQNAYMDLANALDRAANSICPGPLTIYVAQGTYDPNNTPDNSFVLPDDVSVYGGFPSGGCDFSGRDPQKHKTVLTGLIDDDGFPDAATIVTMGDETLIDGFTITHAFEHGIYGSGANFTVENCIIKESFVGYGIYAENGDVAVQWCNISLNDRDGIYHEGEGFNLSVDNSWLLRNGECGIRSEKSTLAAKNSIVSESDLKEAGRAGIRLFRPTYQPVLHNLTVSSNKAEGIYFEDDGDITGDPNNLDCPDLQNSIVYYNNPGGNQLVGVNPEDVANFCCIQDCNEPGTTNHNDAPGFAYAVDPNGAPDPNGTPDPNNYHLAYNAFCIDKGNDLDLDYTDQVDIDGEGVNRQYGDAVDIGADEVYSCDEDLTEDDIYNEMDWNIDGLVNFEEYSAFAQAWLSHDPNEPGLSDPNDAIGWNSKCNLVTTGDSEYVIDLADVVEFVDNGYWLWTACWKQEQLTEMLLLGGEGMMMSEVVIPADVIPAQAGTGIQSYIEAESQDPYADMSIPELVSLITGIDAMLDEVDALLDENSPDAENWLDIKDFLEDVLDDIEASRQ